jgi:hypothetical protein
MKDIPKTRPTLPIIFARGSHLFQIAPSFADPKEYVGYCDGRVLAYGADKAQVARALIDVVP